MTDNDVLPPTGGVDLLGVTIGTGRVQQNSSIHLRLTNYLEQRALYDAYNFQLGDVVNGNSVAANTTVMTTSIGGYFCPSDAYPGSHENLDIGYTVPVACVNYAVNAGTNRLYSEARSTACPGGWEATLSSVAGSASRPFATEPATRRRSASGSRATPAPILLG